MYNYYFHNFNNQNEVNYDTSRLGNTINTR